MIPRGDTFGHDPATNRRSGIVVACMLRDVVLILLGAYALLGAVVGAWFVLRGAGMIDPLAARTGIRVRWIWLPGAVMLWPWVVVRCFATRRSP